MEVLGVLIVAAVWFIKMLALIVLAGVALGVLWMVFIIAREVAWTLHHNNIKKIEREEKENDES